MHIRYILAFVLIAFCGQVSGDTLAVTSYVITDLGPLQDPGYSRVERGAFALNDAGQVVGGDGHAFLWSGGRKTDLGALPPEGGLDDTESVAFGINSQSRIVGNSGSFAPIFMSGLQVCRGFLYEHNRLHQIPPQGGSFEAYAINDKDQIVGLYAYRGFLYENGRVIELGTLSNVSVGNRSTAHAVSNSGQIAGWSTVNKGTFGAPYAGGSRMVKRHGEWIMKNIPVPTRTYFTHACLWRASGKAVRQRDLGTLPGWVNSYAYGINDRGEIIGSVCDSGTDRHRIVPNSTYGVPANSHAQAFLWRRGQMKGLGTLPNSRSSEAFGINKDGTVVGQSDGKAFLWQGGKMHDLNALIPADAGWFLEQARAINSKGRIVGNGNLHGQAHAFLLTPR